MTKHSKVTKSAPTTTNDIQYFPLTDLYVSDLNPRKDLSIEGVELLAQSILACGLIQNLAGLMDEAGKVAIVAGGRRLRALEIAARDNIELALVPVRLAPSVEVAMEWANAENTAREDLHPVDEIRAYLRLKMDRPNCGLQPRKMQSSRPKHHTIQPPFLEPKTSISPIVGMTSC